MTSNRAESSPPREGATASFSPNPASGSPTMTVGTSPATSPGSYPLTTD